MREPSATNADVAVVVPMYNEASVVGAVIDSLVRVFPLVVCVDDGSSDGSPEVARAHGAVVVEHGENLGQGAAIQTGISFALRSPRTRFVITFDADGQHRVSDAQRMLEVARGGVDVVLGSRFLGAAPTGMTRTRRILLKAAIKFTHVSSGIKLTDAHNGLRVLNRRSAGVVAITLNGMAHATELLEQITRHQLSVAEVPVTIDYTDYSRAKGQGNINAVNISFDVLGRRLRSGR